MFKCEIDDPKIEEMDPIRKMWMFYSWLTDQKDKAEFAKNQAYLIGSFINPEAVQKLLGESGTTHKSTDAEFAKTVELMEKEVERSNKPNHKRKKRKIKE